MKYTEEERMEIGRRTYRNELTKHEAMTKYNISESTIDKYIKDYREENNLKPRKCSCNPLRIRAAKFMKKNDNMFSSMSRKDLIDEIIKIRTNTIRMKVRTLSRKELIKEIDKAHFEELNAKRHKSREKEREKK